MPRFSPIRAVASPLALTLATVFAFSASEAAPPEPMDFGRDIRPILSNACFTCHGPDESQRATDLRLDTKAGAFADLGDYRAIVPGDIDASELLRRITSTDHEKRMPPPDAARQLTPAQVERLRSWIAAGAPWREHWAFAPIRRPQPPSSPSSTRRNPIDRFVVAQLAKKKLTPAERADKATLLRRVTLDLTGLPPTLEEIDAFLADDSPEAYERVVDRLLQSTRFGERMALAWLDVARYADTSGYQNDGPREMWRWRDWVIDAYNSNMPFDQFTVEQLAGDLLDPQPLENRPRDYASAWRGRLILEPARLNRLIASAFNRNHRGNAEGGIIPEEYQVEYVVDRVDTTATVWLGLTLGCARCHDHKYDPLKQSDFYRMFAFFNNVPEFGRAVKEGNSPPYIRAPVPEERDDFVLLQQQVAAAQSAFDKLAPQLKRAQQQWEASGPDVSDWSIRSGLLAHFPFDGDLQGVGAEPRKGELSKAEPRFVAGKIGKAVRLRDGQFVNAGDFADFGYFDPFSIGAWVRPENGDGVVLSRMTPETEGDGYHIRLSRGRIQVNLVKRWLDDSLRVETADAIPTNAWSHIVVSYDGTREPTGIRVYVNGRRVKLKVRQDFINQTFAALNQPVRIGGGDVAFDGALDDVRIYHRALSGNEAEIIATPTTLKQILAIKTAERSPAQRRKLARYFLTQRAPQAIQQTHQQLTALQAEVREMLDFMPTLMVMQELREPRETRILKRGEYDKPDAVVSPGAPAVLPPLAAKLPKNRLGLAQWLVAAENPLTARVAVNRAWQLHFGAGLVRTAEDFGVQGEPPSHPQLLDWLAVEFIDSGWDTKALHKRIVMSETYQQSSAVNRRRQQMDPENRWLSRGPRGRLPAELVRDQALAISGLLAEYLGGPSVFPYQPAGLWEEIATDTDYPQSEGEDLYRRSLYTYWKRTVAPPTMATLDAPSRESCVVRRSRTNTPLQALALMNEISFVEAARAFATRALREGGDSEDARLRFMFRSATARPPRAAELAVLKRNLKNHREEFNAAPEAAGNLISTGESPVAEELTAPELAAYTMVASLILNLDEVITKE